MLKHFREKFVQIPEIRREAPKRHHARETKGRQKDSHGAASRNIKKFAYNSRNNFPKQKQCNTAMIRTKKAK